MQEEQSTPIAVENIIEDIRRQILTQKFKEGGKTSQLNLDGNYFSTKFYDNLYQASVSQQEIRLQVIKSNAPLIGPLIDRLRTMIHQVILFYVNQFVVEQARINQLTVELISEMSVEIEKLAQQQEQGGD